MSSFDDDLSQYRSVHEPSHHWHLKKRFIQKHRGDFNLPDLIALAQTFGNIEFLGCTYPPGTMKQVDYLIFVCKDGNVIALDR